MIILKASIMLILASIGVIMSINAFRVEKRRVAEIDRNAENEKKIRKVTMNKASRNVVQAFHKLPYEIAASLSHNDEKTPKVL